MVAIVAVSHSAALADAAVELARQMVGEAAPSIEIAAGSDGGLGTDATAVAAAIERADAASGGTGVLVITDLGSAVMSSEMALELVDELAGEVLLSRAPFVEGLVAAVVQAAQGSSLAVVEREASGALRAKSALLGRPDDPAGPSAAPSAAGRDAETDRIVAGPSRGAGGGGDADGTVTLEVEIVNREGLHARPAVLLAQTAAGLDVDVEITNLATGAGPAAADSMLELMSLGVRQGNRVRLSAVGADSVGALQALAAVIAGGLGEAEEGGAAG